MPWYKSGTANCTLNSAAVIGVGTSFIANSRVGDAFLGPDGEWYEVTNIASDTAMAIAPAYKGATITGGSYALAPMQGYVKDSADALRALVNTYGTKLAALGTTGNYDNLPISKGGTGAEDEAGARTSLSAAQSGANKDITSLNALTTALSVEQGGTAATTAAGARTNLGLNTAALVNIVGTMAAGDIMEVGANANGTYFKYANGMMVIRGEFTGYTGGLLKTVNLPMPFIDGSNGCAVSIIPSTGYEGAATYWCSSTQFNFYSPNTRVSNVVVYVAIGKWN